MKIAHAVLVCAVAALLAACAPWGRPLTDGDRSLVTTDVQLSASKVHPGAPFDIVVTIHNSGPALNLSFRNLEQFFYRIVGEEGIVHFWPREGAPAGSSLFIGTDASVSHGFRFPGTIPADPEEPWDQLLRRQLLPGEYWVEAGLREHGDLAWGAARLVVAR
ncbi:MAG: hypothetical protein R6X35_05660 [Candidatus Krumholzibacteriia bacterium]